MLLTYPTFPASPASHRIVYRPSTIVPPPFPQNEFRSYSLFHALPAIQLQQLTQLQAAIIRTPQTPPRHPNLQLPSTNSPTTLTPSFFLSLIRTPDTPTVNSTLTTPTRPHTAAQLQLEDSESQEGAGIEDNFKAKKKKRIT